MKIHSRSSIIYYVLLFSALCPYLVHLSHSLVSGSSAIDKTLLVNFSQEYLSLIILSLVCIVFTWRMSTYTKWLVALQSLICLVYSMNAALAEFNKVVLIMDFFFLVTAYYLLMVYHSEIESAAYNPLYVKSTIGQRSEFDLPATLKANSNEIHGQLTNWDEQGCFVSLNMNESLTPNLGPLVELETRIDGVHFQQTGKIVSSFEGGVGIRFTIDNRNIYEGYNWNEYFKIIDHRGFVPRSKSV